VFGLRGSAWIAFLVYYSFVNPWLEELFWRGLLARQTSFGWTSDLLYAGYHLFVLAPFITLPWLLFCFILLTATGAFWRFLTTRSDSLALPALTHLVADIAVIVVAWMLAA
jgi:membrane protease YdiL (CAAX protease family)